MNCEQVINRYIHEFLDGELAAEKAEILKKHLSNCQKCNEKMDQLKDSISFIKQSKKVDIPINFTENVMSKLPDEKRNIIKPRSIWKKSLLAAAVLIFMLVSGTYFLMNNDNSPQLVSEYNDEQHESEIMTKALSLNDVVISADDEIIENVTDEKNNFFIKIINRIKNCIQNIFN